jgi:hypothetical protein
MRTMANINIPNTDPILLAMKLNDVIDEILEKYRRSRQSSLELNHQKKSNATEPPITSV